MSDEEAKKSLAEYIEQFSVDGKIYEMSFFQKFFEYQVSANLFIFHILNLQVPYFLCLAPPSKKRHTYN